MNNLVDSKMEKPQNHRILRFFISFERNTAEKEGFEPPDLLQSTVFKTAAIDHSAISPIKCATLVMRLQI